MDVHLLWLIAVVFLMCPVQGLWWALGSAVVLDPTRVCRNARRLRGKQVDICRNEPRIVEQVARGSQIATKECQYQFRNRRWNCSSDRRSIKKLISRDTRETGFVQAITAAGVTYAVTQACSSGQLVQCSCARSVQSENLDWKTGRLEDWKEFKWDGCGDNVAYGYRKARDFLDAKRRRRSDVKTLVLLHNNEAGRLAVKNHMWTECKCHGLSGSCTVRTCWRKMPLFRDIGNRLKDKFDGAPKVIPGNDGKSVIPEGQANKPPGKEDIIYTEDSPDFCVSNRKTGSLGTGGRECNMTSQGVDGCDLLCCDRGYLKVNIKTSENCHCRFRWCCEVTCEVCESRRTITKCQA